ncbi:epoxide hydrolase family protein [Amycolatopsis sp. BJA-103]|uniref:epoxide hydrolase family protein n=1 Tax=Amycolatopsis sp. BJA-103 TaxID=1911175 RepID=UPI000C75EF71|nr:epoxide hydrolase family protein [Amycolatopsis sp. BJA-103]AUI63874.1 epoxide hydrolase [Amycolatopsis sp. BJA-103]PNE15904.1 epoxide hydrolase [Amycolatopsis sp. BJA-103]
MNENTEIRPFRIDVPQSELDDLADRLARVRWANELPADQVTDGVQRGPVTPGWEYGVTLDYVQRLVAYWRDGYDWRKWEAKLNEYPQFTTEIDGQNVHFLHVRSPEPDATPLILTHGWPNSVFEYLDLIDRLTDPRSHDGDPADAFHVVIPSLPGFGFSGATREKGWNRYRTARAWAELMRRLGYERYGTHGNDAGSFVAPEVGRVDAEHVVGVHVTQLFSFPSGDPAEFEGMTEKELEYMQFLQTFNDDMSGYAKLQESAPQNLAHALADSPTGQLAWSAQLLSGTSDDHVLTNATLYWLTNTAASAARFYYEDKHTEHPSEPTTAPTGLASFAYDFRPLRRFADRDHTNIVSWQEFDRGGHWATQDAPDLLLGDIRAFFRKLA